MGKERVGFLAGTIVEWPQWNGNNTNQVFGTVAEDSTGCPTEHTLVTPSNKRAAPICVANDSLKLKEVVSGQTSKAPEAAPTSPQTPEQKSWTVQRWQDFLNYLTSLLPSEFC